MADGTLEIEIGGEPLRLFAERALLWPRRRTLVVADVHLGKAQHFREAGIALPRGGTEHDLERLDRLIEASGATRLLVLGDLLHAGARDAPWRAAWQAWRAGHPALSVDLVGGNHDRALRAAPELARTLGLRLHGALLHEPPFAFVHDVDDAVAADVAGYRLGGHLHPVVRLPGLPRLPAFVFAHDAGLLPAFTAFAGGLPIAPSPGLRLYPCAPGAVVALPASL
ncbi:ligase-associated DNA damage response endonuclease PdeM [Luteimonas sp. TWI1416]|uniref:ligase-associated DNA damage response endonuclease PdeM n=1 Tax=unclassified Luteimonas TaxID=2629088 RepID=UPI00320ADE38